MKKRLFFLILLLGTVAIYAQQVITTAGNFDTETSGSISWTLGEGIIDTYSGSNLILTQGFQQSKLTITSLNNLPDNSLEINVYPNPTSDNLSIKITKGSFDDLKFLLFDINGKLMAEQSFLNFETNISFLNLTAGTYLLKLFKNNLELQVFKIVRE
jgi:hypothetical protein